MMSERILYLIEQCRQAKDQAALHAALHELFEAVKMDLYLFVYRRAKQSEVDDIMQEIWKAIIKSLPSFNGKTAKQFLKWCYTIAIRKVADSFDFYERMEPMSLDDVSRIIDNSEHIRPMSNQDRLDCQEALRLLAESDPDCHEILWNHFILEVEISDIAEQLELKYDAARMRINRCLDNAQGLI